MRTSHAVALTCAFAAFAGATTAYAQDSRLALVREEVHDLGVRTASVRARAERADPRVRRESERIILAVEERRVALDVRLDLIDLTDRNAGEQEVQEIESAYRAAAALLVIVEGWYAPLSR